MCSKYPNRLTNFHVAGGSGLNVNQDMISSLTALKGWSFRCHGYCAAGTKQLWAMLDGSDTIVYGNSSGSTDTDFSIRLQSVTNVSWADFIFA